MSDAQDKRDQEMPAAEKPSASPEPCAECKRLDEPCSPDCFEKAGYQRDHFADFVGALRRERVEKAEADQLEAARVAVEKAEADAVRAHELAEAANAKAAAKAAREASQPKPKRKAATGHALVTVKAGAGMIAFGIHDHKEGETFECPALIADALESAGLVTQAD